MLPWQTWKNLQCCPACCWYHCKQTRARFLPRELMCLLSILSTLRAKITSWNMWRKMIRKRRKPKRKVLGFSWSASLLHPEERTSWEPVERSLNCWSPFPRNSCMMGVKKIKNLDCKEKKKQTHLHSNTHTHTHTHTPHHTTHTYTHTPLLGEKCKLFPYRGFLELINSPMNIKFHLHDFPEQFQWGYSIGQREIRSTSTRSGIFSRIQ